MSSQINPLDGCKMISIKEYEKLAWGTYGSWPVRDPQNTPGKMKILVLGEISTPHMKSIIKVQRNLVIGVHSISSVYKEAVDAILEHRKKRGTLNIVDEIIRALKRSLVPWVDQGTMEETKVGFDNEYIKLYTGSNIFRCSCKKKPAFFYVKKSGSFYGDCGDAFCGGCLRELEMQVIKKCSLETLPLYIGFKFIYEEEVKGAINERFKNKKS
jgi:hypothetical protein